MCRTRYAYLTELPDVKEVMSDELTSDFHVDALMLSVTFFACLIAVAVLRTRVTRVQFAGAGLIVFGLLASALPQPLAARRSFSWALLASALGSLFLATSYPLTELIFRLSRAPPAEEVHTP